MKYFIQDQLINFLLYIRNGKINWSGRGTKQKMYKQVRKLALHYQVLLTPNNYRMHKIQIGLRGTEVEENDHKVIENFNLNKPVSSNDSTEKVSTILNIYKKYVIKPNGSNYLRFEIPLRPIDGNVTKCEKNHKGKTIVRQW